MSDPAAELELGYHGAVRLRVAPRITLSPAPTQFVVAQLQARPPVTGRADNLLDAIPCTLEWLFQAAPGSQVLAGVGAGAEQARVHPRRTLAVPVGGGKFEVRERDPQDTASAPPYRALPLVLDALELGWVGEGRLGYRIVLELLGNPSLTVSPSASLLELRLPVRLEQGWKSARSAVRPVGEPATLGVGPVPWAAGAEVRLEVAEYTRDASAGDSAARASTATTGLVRVPGSETVVTLPPTLSAQAALVGYTAGGRLQGDPKDSRFLYHRSRSAQVHVVAWRCGVSRAEPGAQDVKKKTALPQVTWTEPQVLCEVAHPVLESLRLGLTRRGELAIEGRFGGFDREAHVDLEVELYGLHGEQSASERSAEHASHRITRLSELLGRLEPQVGAAAALRGAPPATGGAFGGVLMRLAACRDALERAYPGLHLFAAVRFPTAQFGEEAEVVFRDGASYLASTDFETHPDGFAPFSEGVFSHPSLATGVCTQQLDLRGTSAPLVATGGLPFSPNAKALRAYRESHTGQVQKTILRRKFSDEARDERNPLRKVALEALSQHFGDRFALYRAVEEITQVSWEIIAVLHVNEHAGDAAPLHVECGFGLDATAHSADELERRLRKYLRSAPPVVKAPFVRGHPGRTADVFQAAIVAADIYRESAIVAKAVEARGERTPIVLGRMSPASIACAAAAYNAGPASPHAAKGLSTGANYQFNLTDDDFRTDFLGGGSSSADGSGRVVASKGRGDGRIRWDVLLPSVQDWALALTVGPLRV